MDFLRFPFPQLLIVLWIGAAMLRGIEMAGQSTPYPPAPRTVAILGLFLFLLWLGHFFQKP